MNKRIDDQRGSPPSTPNRSLHSTPPQSRWQRVSLVVQLLLSLAVAGGTLTFLIWSGWKAPSPDQEPGPARPEEVVTVAGPRVIRVRSGTPLDAKLQVVTVESAWLTAPVLPVTGTTLASLRPGKEGAQDAWQFATSDLLTAFSDWQKAVKDIQFQETQLKAVRDLNESRIDAQRKVVARMEKLVSAGTDTEKDLAVERTNLIQFEIQARKDTHEAEQAVYLSRRTEATLARQLQQAGLEPTMLRSAAAEGDIVVAEVPERAMGRVKLGMTCVVRFYALPEREFTGKVSSISPVISKEKRVLNVQFTVKDPDNLVRPGMFAEIGLGTDKRQALLIPADGVLHVGDKDYVLVATSPGLWQVTEVETGELRGTSVECFSGLKAGERILGKGAILLKPAVVRAMQSPAPSAAPASSGDQPGGKGP
jgi:multidrug efflux pump subunit AcrA (membrane-fusion protein)